MRFRIIEDHNDIFMDYTRKLVERKGVLGWTRWVGGSSLLPSGYNKSLASLKEETYQFYIQRRLPKFKKRVVTEFELVL